MSSTTLALVASPPGVRSRVAWRVLLAFAGSWLVAALAQIEIRLPFTPVPITGQTLGVLLVGASLGAGLGAVSMALYLLQGAVGLPFFSGGGSGTDFLTLYVGHRRVPVGVRAVGRGGRRARRSEVGPVGPQLDRRDVPRRGGPVRGRDPVADAGARRLAGAGARGRAGAVRGRRHDQAARGGRPPAARVADPAPEDVDPTGGRRSARTVRASRTGARPRSTGPCPSGCASPSRTSSRRRASTSRRAAASRR